MTTRPALSPVASNSPSLLNSTHDMISATKMVKMCAIGETARSGQAPQTNNDSLRALTERCKRGSSCQSTPHEFDPRTLNGTSNPTTAGKIWKWCQLRVASLLTNGISSPPAGTQLPHIEVSYPPTDPSHQIFL